MIWTILFFLLNFNSLANETLYGSQLSAALIKFSNRNPICDLKIKLEANLISIDSSKYRGPSFCFDVPNEKLKDLYNKIGGQTSECKQENQMITCKSEEAGQMPEHITQSYQHLVLKLDQTGNIVNMHAYKIQKSFLFNKELKYLEKKYSEFYCPPKEQASNDKEINDSTTIKTRSINDGEGLDEISITTRSSPAKVK